MRAIDLGLSVNWADCNIGAETPFDNGALFTWDDIAHIEMGRGVKMPTKAQMIELLQNCEFERIIKGRSFVLKVTGPNGNCIYLPEAGNEDENGIRAKGGFYWTSTEAIEEDGYAYQLMIYNEEITLGYNLINVKQSARLIFDEKRNVPSTMNRAIKNDVLLNNAEKYEHIKSQISSILHRPCILSDINEATDSFKDQVPEAVYTQMLTIWNGKTFGHSDVYFVFDSLKQFIGLVITHASFKFIEEVKESGVVYGATYKFLQIGLEFESDALYFRF